MSKEASKPSRQRNRSLKQVRKAKSSNRLNKNMEEVNVELFKPLYEDLFEGATYARINPFACIRLVKIRPICAGGVFRLMCLFRQKYEHVDDIPSLGLTFGTDTPIVVELKGNLRHHLYDHFREQGLSDEEIEVEVSKHDKWYGIIDGGHSNAAVIKLCTSFPEWRGFKWFVTLLAGGYSVDRYRQLARAQNGRHSPRFFIELTLFDQLNNLKIEYDNIRRHQSEPTQVQVARSYFGTHTVSNTCKFLSALAYRLPSCTLHELGLIMNLEKPEDCLKHESFDSCGATTADEVMSTTDCRMFRSFVTLHTLRMATAFMNAKGDAAVRAQINTLHRAKELFMLNGLKTVQYTAINQQYNIALLAINEEAKFLKYLDSSEWPPQMENIKFNLLRSTLLDGEIEGNAGNEHTVLDSLRKGLLLVSPNIVKQCDERLRRITEPSPPNSPSLDNGVPQGDDDSPTPPDISSSNSNQQTPDNLSEDSDLNKQLLDSNIEKLKSHGIECFNMDWRTYLTSMFTSDSEKVDTIVTEPPSISSRSFLAECGMFNANKKGKGVEEELTEDEVTEMPKLAKRVLKPGGYILIIIDFDAFPEWMKSFVKSGFTVMPYPYVFGYRSSSLQDRNPKYLPQVGSDFALVAYLPHEHQFRPDFKSVFTISGPSMKRNIAIMTDIPAPRSKLRRPGTRSPFISNEKSVTLLAEALDLFTPKGGLTLDLYGGTFTTPIAALLSGRRCICIEKKTDLFQAAITRLITCLKIDNLADTDQSANITFSNPQGIEPVFNEMDDLSEEEDELEGMEDQIQSQGASKVILGVSQNDKRSISEQQDKSTGIQDGATDRQVTLQQCQRKRKSDHLNSSSTSGITMDESTDSSNDGESQAVGHKKGKHIAMDTDYDALQTLASVANADKTIPLNPSLKRVSALNTLSINN